MVQIMNKTHGILSTPNPDHNNNITDMILWYIRPIMASRIFWISFKEYFTTPL